MKLRREKLELVGRIKLDDDHFADMQDLVAIYMGRNADLPLPRPFWQPQDIMPVSQYEPRALAALIEAHWHIWRECGGKGHGTRWDVEPGKGGAFIQFVRELFGQAGIRRTAKSEWSASTLRAVAIKIWKGDDQLAQHPEDEATTRARWQHWIAAAAKVQRQHAPASKPKRRRRR